MIKETTCLGVEPNFCNYRSYTHKVHGRIVGVSELCIDDNDTLYNHLHFFSQTPMRDHRLKIWYVPKCKVISL